MVDVLVGLKGSGKTSKILDEINEQAASPDSNIVCIEYGRRLDRLIPYHVRMVDITEYPVKGYGELLSFIAGISAKDYDISHLYVDSIFKVAGDANLENLATFLHSLEAFTETNNMAITLTVSVDPNELPESVCKYIRELEH